MTLNVNDVLTSALLCYNMTLVESHYEQHFKNTMCFCQFDVYAIAHEAQIAQICISPIHTSIRIDIPCFKGSG